MTAFRARTNFVLFSLFSTWSTVIHGHVGHHPQVGQSASEASPARNSAPIALNLFGICRYSIEVQINGFFRTRCVPISVQFCVQNMNI